MIELVNRADQFILEDIVKEKIVHEGPITFCDFMQTCLYHPQYGYYTHSTENIGKTGDYYTSPYVTPVFGKILARQFEEMWRILGGEEFSIVEIGGGNGLLGMDILAELSRNNQFSKHLSYCIVEKNDRVEFPERLDNLCKIKLIRKISELSKIRGCIFSNELIDNFPVHRVIMGEELMEVFVDYNGQFVEVLRPADEQLKKYFESFDIQLPTAWMAEINLQMKPWIDELASVLDKGFVMTIDYGGSSDELYSWRKRNGTLACFRNHRVHFNPYINIGRQDITAHVNFSAIKKWGLDANLQFTGYTDQVHFLKALGLTCAIREEEKKKNFQSGQIFFFLNSFLVEMGSRIKVLVLQKGLPALSLSGLQFGQILS